MEISREEAERLKIKHGAYEFSDRFGGQYLVVDGILLQVTEAVQAKPGTSYNAEGPDYA